MKLFDKLLRWNELHTLLKAAEEAGIEIAKENGDLRVENAKLRELLAELYQCSRQVGCDHCGDGYRRTCSVLNHLRELGMEVVV